MRRTNTERLEEVERNIRERRVMSFDDVLHGIDCSAITLRRDLKALNTISSYTHSGRFITLPGIPQFDGHGIWIYRKIGFSRFGTSLDTIVGLIEQSEGGFSRIELEEILGIRISQQIQVLMQRGKLHRVKMGNQYLYIPEAAQRNKKKKLKLIGARQTEEYFEKAIQKTDLVALLKAVLVESKVGIEIESIKRIAKKYSLRIPPQKIQRLLVKYDLPEKKTP